MSFNDKDGPLFADLDDTDPDLVAAVSDAQRTLPLFLDAVSTARFPRAGCLAKVAFFDRSELGMQALVRTPETALEHSASPVCHLWLNVTSVLEQLVFCSVYEAPVELLLKEKDSFVVSSDSIEDWCVNENGVVFGGYSLRVVRSRLRRKAQAKFDVHTGIRTFAELTSMGDSADS